MDCMGLTQVHVSFLKATDNALFYTSNTKGINDVATDKK